MQYPYAVIAADPNSSEIGDIKSQHKRRDTAERALSDLPWSADNRFAYVAARRADGEWQHRVEALDNA